MAWRLLCAGRVVAWRRNKSRKVAAYEEAEEAEE
jgi:hypothetical protein